MSNVNALYHNNELFFFLLLQYATIVTLLVILEVAVGVVAIVYKDKVENYLQTYLKETLNEYYTGKCYS
jgi:hypothetical protein